MGDHKTDLPSNFPSSFWRKHGYLISQAMFLIFIIALLGAIPFHLLTLTVEDVVLLWANLRNNTVSLIFSFAFLVFLGAIYWITRPRKVYLVDFACYKPPPELMCSRKESSQRAREFGVFSEENLGFMTRILERSGIGEKAYFPEVFFGELPNPTMVDARKEAEMVMFGSIDQLLAKTGVKARDIGILVVNCGVFCPTPSLSSVIVNHYKLRSNILSYNLGGMGCSAGIISIDLAKHHLQVSYA